MSRTFDAMPATLASQSPPTSPPFHRRRKSWARKVERFCCSCMSYFPLVFIYGLTTWAVYVEVSISFLGRYGWLASAQAGLGALLYGLANVSYTLAVFTDPGSPLQYRPDAAAARKRGAAGYSSLPSYESEAQSGLPHGMSMVTAKSTGQPRYCKKCQTVKPDRAHHCSTCGRCVLKMDHHCPWLATCAGLHNYKPFLLFLTYTSLFCWLCFVVSAAWVWTGIMDETEVQEGFRVINTILLAVLGGIIGLVLSGFTGWHLYLAATGQTTIESLEKTRYLSPLRKSMEQQFQAQRNYVGQSNGNGEHEQSLTDHLKEIHANALPGVTRLEEGEDRNSNPPSPAPPGAARQHPSSSPADSSARDSLRRSYASLEAEREHQRYEGYLDELDSERLPNAFGLGWKRNLTHVFGDRPLFWGLPVRNTSGDGWQWEVSPKWFEAREAVARDRAARQLNSSNGAAHVRGPPPSMRWTPGQGFVDQARQAPQPLGSGALYGRRSPNKADQVLGREPGQFYDGVPVPLQPLDGRKTPNEDDGAESHDTSSDETEPLGTVRQSANNTAGVANWNDVPDDFLARRGARANSRSRSRGRRKGD